MKFQLLSALLVAATSVTAQQSIPFTHPQTGLRFQALTHPSSQSSFGIALPPVGGPTNEFIGQISARLNSGWYGVSLGGGMLNNLLIAAWQNGNNIVSSFRLTGSYGSPPTYTRAGPTITPICTSYQTNSTHWTFTFVCKDCNAWTLSSGQQTKIDLAGDFQVMGYAGHTSSKPSQPAQPGSSVPKHTYQGQFGMNFQAARSSDYDAFKRCERGTGGGPSSSSTTSTSTTTTKTTTTTTSSTPTPTETPQPKWAQCGGTWWTGSKTCVAGTKCVFINDGYSQCQ